MNPRQLLVYIGLILAGILFPGLVYLLVQLNEPEREWSHPLAKISFSLPNSYEVSYSKSLEPEVDSYRISSGKGDVKIDCLLEPKIDTETRADTALGIDDSETSLLATFLGNSIYYSKTLEGVGISKHKNQYYKDIYVKDMACTITYTNTSPKQIKEILEASFL